MYCLLYVRPYAVLAHRGAPRRERADRSPGAAEGGRVGSPGRACGCVLRALWGALQYPTLPVASRRTVVLRHGVLLGLETVATYVEAKLLMLS